MSMVDMSPKKKSNGWWDIIGALGEGLAQGGGWSEGLARGARNLAALDEDRQREREEREQLRRSRDTEMKMQLRNMRSEARMPPGRALPGPAPSGNVVQPFGSRTAMNASRPISWGPGVSPEKKKLFEALLMGLGRR